MKNPEPSPRDARQVLVVDDDPASLVFLEGVLLGRGLRVATAASVDEACAALERDSLAAFGCVITDCLMPVKTGIDLLHWVHERDSTLGTVMITAGTERQIAAESLRGGACDFLEKPIGGSVLVAAAERAMALTNERRKARETQDAVKVVGAYQHRQLIASAGGADAWPLEVCFHPRSEAGGDFLSHFRLGGDQRVYLLTDVSGHDLKAAFLSAYFQGMVRGMMERQATVREIFDHFNRFLLSEWKDAAASGGGGGLGASVAACSILTDRVAGFFEVVNCGSPLPVLTDASGQPEPVGRADGYPLGWFDENPVEAVRKPLPLGGSLTIWTDGLEAFADEQRVSPLAVATALLLGRTGRRAVPELKKASDDILVSRILFPGDASPPTHDFMPLVVEDHPGNIGRTIDALQQGWERSLRYCLPDIGAGASYAILLATREAVLNACVHGCAGREDCFAKLRMSYDPVAGLVRVVVQDPGTGHAFNLKMHKEATAQELIAAHRGLMLIEQLSDRLLVERNGARLVMDFSLNRSWT